MVADLKIRCAWVGDDPLYVQHHDLEWGVPVYDSRALWEHLVLDGFQAGLSWRTILLKRDNFRRAFSGFEPERVARFGEKDVTKLLGNPGIIRSRVKINSAINNARAYLDLPENGHKFSEWIWGFAGGKPIQNAWTTQKDVPAETPLAAELSKALKSKGFKFVGPTMVYAWMQAVGMVNDHTVSCFRHLEVKRLANKFSVPEETEFVLRLDETNSPIHLPNNRSPQRQRSDRGPGLITGGATC